MNKQTATEWLYEQLTSTWFDKSSGQHILEQAKEMEKEQIEDAYDIGFADAWDDARYDDEPKYAGSELYYNEQYGGNK